MNRTLALLVGVLPLVAGAQQIYRWTDSSGGIHFSQNPPTSGAYTNVTPNNAPGPGPDPAYHPGAGVLDQPSDQKAKQAALKSKADNEERCAKANERVSYLEEKTAHRLYKTGPDGEPARLTDEEFDAELSDAKAAAAKYCQ